MSKYAHYTKNDVIGYFTGETVWYSLALISIEHGIDDYAITAVFNNETEELAVFRRTKIHTSESGLAYVVRHGKKYYFHTCVKTGR